MFETPHPFGETFEEEEVIADRYAAAVPPPVPSPPIAEPAPAVAAAVVAATANEAEPVSASESREELPSETIAMPYDREVAWKDGAESEVAVATVAVPAQEPAPRPKRPAVPPPRQEFGRLFAKLRQGL